jgi:hypothetical protein
MDPSAPGERRFSRESVKPRLAEAPPAGRVAAEEEDRGALLDRLERQAADTGRLEGRVQTLERALKAEREARRRIADTLKRERKAAEALHQRAERAAAEHVSAADEAKRARQAAAFSEQQVRLVWAQLSEAERQLAWKSRPLWRKLLRRPPAAP